jgi:hypothetical protein
LRSLVFGQEPTEFVNTLGEIILSNNFEGLVIENDHSQNVKMTVSLRLRIEVGRSVSNFSSIAVRRKLSMKGLSTSGIYDIEQRQGEVTAISNNLIMGVVIWI